MKQYSVWLHEGQIEQSRDLAQEASISHQEFFRRAIQSAIDGGLIVPLNAKQEGHLTEVAGEDKSKRARYVADLISRDYERRSKKRQGKTCLYQRRPD